MSTVPSDDFEPNFRMSRDLKLAAATMTPDQARYLVDTYYMMQKPRVRSGNQVKALQKLGEPHACVEWTRDNAHTLEKQVSAALRVYANSKPIGVWAQGIVGVAHVLAAGLMAHIDLSVLYAGQIWQFAGLNPGVTWEKGKKRPWNASLKTLCYKVGESFVKVQNRDGDFYGQIFAEHKRKLWQQNLNGEFVDAAAKRATEVNKSTEAYKWYTGKFSGANFDGDFISGIPAEKGVKGLPMLAAAHIHARARRATVKLFLSHFHAVGHLMLTGNLPPKPYAIQHLGHHDLMLPPNLDDEMKAKFLAW